MALDHVRKIWYTDTDTSDTPVDDFVERFGMGKVSCISRNGYRTGWVKYFLSSLSCCCIDVRSDFVVLLFVTGGGLEMKKDLRSVVCERVWDVIHAKQMDVTSHSTTSTSNIVVGIGLVCTCIGILVVMMLFFKYYIQNKRSGSGGERYTTFLNQDGEDGIGRKGETRENQENTGLEERRVIALTDVVDHPHDIA